MGCGKLFKQITPADRLSEFRQLLRLGLLQIIEHHGAELDKCDDGVFDQGLPVMRLTNAGMDSGCIIKLRDSFILTKSFGIVDGEYGVSPGSRDLNLCKATGFLVPQIGSIAQQTADAAQRHQRVGLLHHFHRALRLPGQAQ